MPSIRATGGRPSGSWLPPARSPTSARWDTDAPVLGNAFDTFASRSDIQKQGTLSNAYKTLSKCNDATREEPHGDQNALYHPQALRHLSPLCHASVSSSRPPASPSSWPGPFAALGPPRAEVRQRRRLRGRGRAGGGGGAGPVGVYVFRSDFARAKVSRSDLESKGLNFYSGVWGSVATPHPHPRNDRPVGAAGIPLFQGLGGGEVMRFYAFIAYGRIEPRLSE